MPFNPVPLRLEAVGRLLLFPVPLRLGTYGKGREWMLAVCLRLALSLVLRNTNQLQPLMWFPAPLLVWRGVARDADGRSPRALGPWTKGIISSASKHRGIARNW